MDNFGFCTSEADVPSLLPLADYDRLFVKALAWFCVSDEEYPHADAQRRLHEVIEKFGAKRELVASDFPSVTEQCSYVKAFEPLHSAQLSSEDLKRLTVVRRWIRVNCRASALPLRILGHFRTALPCWEHIASFRCLHIATFPCSSVQWTVPSMHHSFSWIIAWTWQELQFV